MLRSFLPMGKAAELTGATSGLATPRLAGASRYREVVGSILIDQGGGLFLLPLFARGCPPL